MINGEAVAELKDLLCDRYTPEELIELLGVSTAAVFDRFVEEIMELDLDEIL